MYDIGKFSTSQDFDLYDNPKYNNFLERQTMASNGVDLSKDTLAEQMPAKSELGVGGTEVAGAGISPTTAMMGGKLILDTLDKAYEAKNAQNMLRYQQRLAEFNKNQNVLQKMASAGYRV